MGRTGITHVLFDFFGTLVNYAPGGPAAPIASVAQIGALGVEMDAGIFSEKWDAVYAEFEADAFVGHREFSMEDLALAFLTPMLPREPTADEVRALASAYLREWNVGVTYPASTPTVVKTLADRFTLAVVSNTHEPDLVPEHLAAMGIADRFATVVTSVSLGWRKPHPSIYGEALRRLDIGPEQAIFVGDNYEADFVGPEAYGIRAYLIDPAGRHGVPDDQRLRSLDDLLLHL